MFVNEKKNDKSGGSEASPNDEPQNLSGEEIAASNSTSFLKNYSLSSRFPIKRTKSKKSNKSDKPGRSQNSTVVFGKIDSLEKFQELLEEIKAQVGEVRSHYYRDHQDCGFAYFHDEDTARKTIALFEGKQFHGELLKACVPLEFFENEEDARPVPANSARRESVESIDRSPIPGVRRASQVAAVNIAGDPACTLVLKNLSYNLKQEKLIELLHQMGIAPQSVNYHYDQNGTFCGVAFAKYKTVDDAKAALEKLLGLEIGKRKLKVEYKRRRNSITSGHGRIGSIASIGSVGSVGSVASIAFGDMFDPLNMDADQAQIMADLQRFKENPAEHEVSFPPSMTLAQCTSVHLIAAYLGLHHATTGTSGSCYVVVSKSPFVDPETTHTQRTARIMSMDSGSAQLDHQTRLSRFNARQPQPFRNTFPREQFAQPKGPDGSKGFAFGRGRRVVSASFSQPQDRARKPFSDPPAKKKGGSPPLVRAADAKGLGVMRSTSMPSVVMRPGSEFNS